MAVSKRGRCKTPGPRDLVAGFSDLFFVFSLQKNVQLSPGLHRVGKGELDYTRAAAYKESVLKVNNALTVHDAVRAGPHPACSTVSLSGIDFQVLCGYLEKRIGCL